MTYTSNTIYIDLETGEQLRAIWAKKYYLTIKTKKDVKPDYKNGRCHITYTKLVRRNPQIKIFND